MFSCSVKLKVKMHSVWFCLEGKVYVVDAISVIYNFISCIVYQVFHVYFVFMPIMVVDLTGRPLLIQALWYVLYVCVCMPNLSVWVAFYFLCVVKLIIHTFIIVWFVVFSLATG